MSILLSKRYLRGFVVGFGILLIFCSLKLVHISTSNVAKYLFWSGRRPLDLRQPVLPPTEADDEGHSGFPDRSSYAEVLHLAGSLPLQISIALPEAVKGIDLAGWEDEWFSRATFNSSKWGSLQEPKIDILYNWVNGSEPALMRTMNEYEEEFTEIYNENDGPWRVVHTHNRYRVWDEFRYSLRSVQKYAPKSWRNKIQVLVHDLKYIQDDKSLRFRQQKPTWMRPQSRSGTDDGIELLSHHEVFPQEAKGCLPTFNSRSIETQIYNTASDTDRILALNDDMFLAKQHAASDIYSPLFGSAMAFKTNRYNKQKKPDMNDLSRFGEKPGLIFTSWLLNQRFGPRKRSGQSHIGRSISRRVTAEALATFPSSSLKSSCRRFRNEGQQHNVWYLSYHYTAERHRETLLWSYLLRMDKDEDGHLDPEERRAMMDEIKAGEAQIERGSMRQFMHKEVPALHKTAGLEPPKAINGTLWTSMDGPYMIQDLDCHDVNATKCLGLDIQQAHMSLELDSVFKNISYEQGKCGDCMLKTLLEQVPRGLEPLLPPGNVGTAQATTRQMIIKALVKYQYSIIEPNYIFVMVNGTESVREGLINRLFGAKNDHGSDGSVGQICLNDDVQTKNTTELNEIQDMINIFYSRLYSIKNDFEI